MATDTGTLRQPRAWLDIGGVGNVNLLEVEVTQSGGIANSTCEGKIALDDPTSPDAMWWSETDPASIKATVWVDNGDGTGSNWLIQAKMTKIDIDFGPRVVKFEGEGSFWSDALQTRSDANYPNMTIRSLITQLAGQSGMGVVVGSGDSSGLDQPAGRTYDKQNYNFLTDMENVGDAIQQLANQAGLRAFVHGNNLYLAPRGASFGNDYQIQYEPPGADEAYDQANATQICCSHKPRVSGATSTSQNVIDKTAYISEPTDAFGFAEPGTEGDNPALLGSGQLDKIGSSASQPFFKPFIVLKDSPNTEK
jgi:hypothetical protein